MVQSGKRVSYQCCPEKREDNGQRIQGHIEVEKPGRNSAFNGVEYGGKIKPESDDERPDIFHVPEEHVEAGNYEADSESAAEQHDRRDREKQNIDGQRDTEGKDDRDENQKTQHHVDDICKHQGKGKNFPGVVHAPDKS